MKEPIKIESITIKNFRILKDVYIKFNEDITCIVGENDSGKTSLIDCIRIFSSDNPYKIEIDDFYRHKIKNDKNLKPEIEKEIYIELQLTNGIKVVKKFFLNENNITSNTKVFYAKEYINKQLNQIEISLTKTEKNKQLKELEVWKENSIKQLAKKLDIDSRKNRRVDTILEDINNKLSQFEDKIEAEEHFNIMVYYLDSLTIDKPEIAIEKLFLSDIKTAIWSRKISDNIELNRTFTVKDLLQNELHKLKNEKEKFFREKVEEKLKEFLGERDLRLEINSELEEQPLKINLKTHIKDKYGNEISIMKKGLGTQRRVTMALLELKLQEENNGEGINIFIFDEPDTHLHIKAQRELFKLLRTYSNTKQIIITTHSPYILNLLKPSEIRVLELKKLTNGKQYTVLKSIAKHDGDSNQIEKLLKDLGIENTLLFFGRKLLIVEGKTERVFIETLYSEFYKMTPYGDFIKIIEAQGVTDASRLVKVLLEDLRYSKNDIYLMVDADIENRHEEETSNIIKTLENKGWDKGHLFKIGKGGYKEFEGIFHPEHIYKAWKNYIENRSKKIGLNWTLKNIKEVFEKYKNNDDKKIRRQLKSLNEGCGVKFDHADSFPKALAQYYAENIEELPEIIHNLLQKLKEEVV